MLLALFCACSGAAAHAQTLVLIEGLPDVSRRAVLNAGGILVENPDLLQTHILARLTPEQQAAVAAQGGLRIGRAIPDFAAGQPVMACHLSGLSPSAPTAGGAIIGDGWDGPGLGSVVLTYTWGPMSPIRGNPEQENKATVLSAMSQWSSVAAIDFVPGSDPKAHRNIHIAFLPNNHGGDTPFNSALTHASYPPPFAPEPLAGDVHFNETLPWYLYKLDKVALHALGHALGLTHRVDVPSIMYPYYPGMEWSAADVAAIQSLYTPRVSLSAYLTPTPSRDRSMDLSSATPTLNRDHSTALTDLGGPAMNGAVRNTSVRTTINSPPSPSDSINGLSIVQESSSSAPWAYEFIPFQGTDIVGAFRQQMGSWNFSGTWDHIWRIGYNVAADGSEGPPRAPAREHTFYWSIESNYNDGVRNMLESYFETSNPFTATTQRPWSVNVNRKTDVIQQQFSFGGNDGYVVFQQSPEYLEVFGILPGYVRFRGQDLARMSADNNGYPYVGFNAQHAATRLKSITRGNAAGFEINGDLGLMLYAGPNMNADTFLPGVWQVNLNGDSVQSGKVSAPSFWFDSVHQFASMDPGSGATSIGSNITYDGKYASNSVASGTIARNGYYYIYTGAGGAPGTAVPERIMIDRADGSVWLRAYQSAGLLATDASGKMVRIPGAVTASGSSCTITSITQGAITGATCTPGSVVFPKP